MHPQLRQAGVHLTLRSLIARLENLSSTETYCWDSSVTQRLTPVDEEQRLLLLVLAGILKELRWPRLRPALPAPPAQGALPGSSSGNWLTLPLEIPVR